MISPYAKGGKCYREYLLCAAVYAASRAKCKCGGHVRLDQRKDGAEWQAHCSQCGAKAKKRKTRTGALTAWVLRVTPKNAD